MPKKMFPNRIKVKGTLSVGKNRYENYLLYVELSEEEVKIVQKDPDQLDAIVAKMGDVIEDELKIYKELKDKRLAVLIGEPP